MLSFSSKYFLISIRLSLLSHKMLRNVLFFARISLVCQRCWILLLSIFGWILLLSIFGLRTGSILPLATRAAKVLASFIEKSLLSALTWPHCLSHI